MHKNSQKNFIKFKQLIQEKIWIKKYLLMLLKKGKLELQSQITIISMVMSMKTLIKNN